MFLYTDDPGGLILNAVLRAAVTAALVWGLTELSAAYINPLSVTYLHHR